MDKNKIFLTGITELSEHQRTSYYEFLYKGIEEEFLSLPNPILIHIFVPTRLKRTLVYYYFHPHEIYILGPNCTYKHALNTNLTYGIQFYMGSSYTYSFIYTKDFYPICKSIFKIFSSKTSPIFLKRKALKLLKKFHPLFDFTKLFITGSFTDFWFNLSQDVTNIFEHSSNSLNSLKKIKNIWINHKMLLGEIPLMTDEGTFLVTGCERIVISQIIRNSGVYFQKQFCPKLGIQYCASIVSDHGSLTKFTLAKRNQNDFLSHDAIYIEFFEAEELDIDNYLINIYDFLEWFGLSWKEIKDNLKYFDYLENQDFYFCSERRSNFKINFTENFTEIFSSLFYDARKGYFLIGKKTRYYLNQKFNLRIPENFTYLSILDFLGIIDGLIELKYLNKLSDDIDHIKNKHIRSIGDFLKLQLKAALVEYELTSLFNVKIIDNNNKNLNSNLLIEYESDIQPWIDPQHITGFFKSFFKTSPLSQFMDQVNPLSEIGQKRKISSFGPNGLDRAHISTEIRDIHPSQYGRLCCIETPEGQTAGLISSLALYARVGKYGSLESPYYQLCNKSFNLVKPIIYLNPNEESKLQVGFSSIILNDQNEIITEKISIKDNYSFFLKPTKDTNFFFISPLQILSLAASLVPFIEHDDANRALMGANMQRQAVPLLFPQKAIVGTGLEPAAIIASKLIVKSFSEGLVKLSTSTFLEILDNNNQKIIYQLIKYGGSNQDVAINQRPVVWPGEKVYFGQIIADGPGTKDGELSLGRNLLVAYMPWEGYNFEDAIIVNETLVVNDSLTSVHVQELETTLEIDESTPIEKYEDENDDFDNSINSEITQNKKLKKKKEKKKEKILRSLIEPNNTDLFIKLKFDIDYLSLKESIGSSYSKRNLDPSGVIKIGAYVRKNDVLIAKFIRPTCLDKQEEFVQDFHLLLYGYSVDINRDNSFCVPEGYEGRILDIRCILQIVDPLFESEEFENRKVIIRILIGQLLKLEIGDKLAGRHGNKGVISKILSRQDMPYLPDGSIIDILLNPLGVPSRMNLGQIFESILGFCGEKLGKHFRISPFDEIYGKEASKILITQKIKEVALKTNISWLTPHNKIGKFYLKDGRTGEYLDNPVMVGRSYILKLIHVVEEKIHARSTGPYSLITEQPLAGKSQQGGQRFGEMEVWALEAYGCSNTLQELLTVKSDDIDSRMDLVEVLSGESYDELPKPSISEGLLILIRELNALGFDLTFYVVNTKINSSLEFITQNVNIFMILEKRLKLKDFLAEQIFKLEDLNNTLLKFYSTPDLKKKKSKPKKKLKLKKSK